MLLKEIIENIDMTKTSVVIDADEICESLGISDYVMYTPCLTEYNIGPWICTDTLVGYNVIFFNNKPVALSVRLYRKSSAKIEWFSIEDANAVRAYILSLMDDHQKFDIISLYSNFGDGYTVDFASQIKNIATHVLYNGNLCKIKKTFKEINRWRELVVEDPNGVEHLITTKDCLIPWE
jgi:hypothetical protein